jgi:septal ring factor EnvC (AmiA/AmiB activator)
MSVIFKTFDVIEIDGIASGNIVDVISNHAPRRAEVLAAFGVYVAALQTEINAEKTQLQADKTQLTTDLATANASIATLTTQVASLESQLQEVTESRDVLFIKKQAVDHDLAEAEVKIAWLESIRTYDPNQIKSKAFYDRITKDEMNDVAVLALSGDATAAAIYAKFNDYVKNEWQVLLDDPEVVGGTQYLTHTGTFKEGRAAQITRPASREEAYIAE